jgi:hypothetical protein
MQKFQPDFAVDPGDFDCQIFEGQTTREIYDGQLEALKHQLSVFGELKYPSDHVRGNYDTKAEISGCILPKNP